MTTTKDTLATVKAHCRRLGLDLEYTEAGRYETVNADCPPGRCLEPGLHHFGATWLIGDKSERQDAINDLCDRLANLATLESCDDPECDWCRG